MKRDQKEVKLQIAWLAQVEAKKEKISEIRGICGEIRLETHGISGGKIVAIHYKKDNGRIAFFLDSEDEATTRCLLVFCLEVNELCRGNNKG